MTNIEFIENNKNVYSSLSNLECTTNTLSYNGISIYLENLSLEKIFNYCPSLYQTNPNLILEVIEVCVIISKNTLNDIDKFKLKKYLDNYVKKNETYLSNDEKNSTVKDINDIELYSYQMPISIIEEEPFKNNEAYLIINDYFDKYNSKIESNEKSNQRVRKIKLDPSININDIKYEKFKDDLRDYENAGFITVFILMFVIFTTITIITVMNM